MNLYNSRKVKKKWRELTLKEDKKFNFTTILDYGVATSTNDKKIKKLRQEKLVEQKRNKLYELDNRELMREISNKKQENFFTKLRRENEGKKRKRDAADLRQEEDPDKNKKKKVQLGDEKLGAKPKSDASGKITTLTRTFGEQVTRNKMRTVEMPASTLNFQLGKIKEMSKLFEDKIDRKLEIQRGQHLSLAGPTNQKQAYITTASEVHHPIGGDFANKTARTNENDC